MPVVARHKAQIIVYHLGLRNRADSICFVHKDHNEFPFIHYPGCVCVLKQKLYGVEEAQSVIKSTHLLPRVSYCLIFLMKWTFLDALGPGEPGRFCVL